MPSSGSSSSTRPGGRSAGATHSVRSKASRPAGIGSCSCVSSSWRGIRYGLLPCGDQTPGRGLVSGGGGDAHARGPGSGRSVGGSGVVRVSDGPGQVVGDALGDVVQIVVHVDGERVAIADPERVDGFLVGDVGVCVFVLCLGGAVVCGVLCFVF